MSGQHTGGGALVALVRAAADPASEEELRRAVSGFRSVLAERLARRPMATVALDLGVSHQQVRAAAKLLGVEVPPRRGRPPGVLKWRRDQDGDGFVAERDGQTFRVYAGKSSRGARVWFASGPGPALLGRGATAREAKAACERTVATDAAMPVWKG